YRGSSGSRDAAATHSPKRSRFALSTARLVLFPMKPRSQLWYGSRPMRSWRWARGAISRTLPLILLTTAFVGEAAAKECTNPLINTCINSDTFWPNSGPTRFVTIAGTETVGQGQVGFGLVATYLSRPVVLHVASP